MDIFNYILTSSIFPESWKHAKIIPVHKNSSTYNLNDYRPISILSSLSKVFEKLISKQISSFLNHNNLLVNFQSGFRPQHSTETALLKVVSDLRCNINSKLSTALVLLDFSKAFDTVNHDILLLKLTSFFNFNSSAVTLISTYLSNRKQCVSLNNIMSSCDLVSSGVPQGSVLGPLLFSLFINDLPLSLKFSSYHLYADDFQIYISGNPKSIGLMINELNDDLNSVNLWAISNGLKLNASKTQVLIINGKIDSAISPIRMNNENVVPSDVVKNLGVLFNSNLNFHEYVLKITKTVYGILARLWKLSNFTPRSVRKQLVVCLCVPHFIYCASVLGRLDSFCQAKLNRAFNSCVRYIYGLRKFDRISMYVNSVLGCDIISYLRYRSLCFLFKLILSRKPYYLFQNLEFGSSLRTRNLIPLANSTAQLNASFFVRTICDWNGLPTDIKLCTSCSLFKYKCLHFFAG